MQDSQPSQTGVPARSASSVKFWLPLVVIGVMAIASLAGTLLLLRNGLKSDGKPRDFAQEARDDLERRKFQPLSDSLKVLLADPKYQPIPTQAHPLLLGRAPDFSLRDVDGGKWSLSQKLKEGPVVLVFYYGYHCNHCVSQLFALDKDIDKFRELGAHVVAISADPVELTRERYGQYGAFKFAVLSDPGNRVAEKYGTFAPNPKAGEEGDQMHGTFIINREGKIMWANRGDSPFVENRTLLHHLASHEGRAKAPR